MPRTRVPKKGKRNREFDERVSDFEVKKCEFKDKLKHIGRQLTSDLEYEIKALTNRISKLVLDSNFREISNLCPDKVYEYARGLRMQALSNTGTVSSQSICNTTVSSVVQTTTRSINRNDEGYITEDSSASSIGGGIHCIPIVTSATVSQTARMQQEQPNRGRTPGPLNSARARRPRRSRSACGDLVVGSTIKSKPSAVHNSSSSEHSSRNKLRTPTVTRPKAISADRTPRVYGGGRSGGDTTTAESPPTAFLRWPKPGEIVLSTCGSPVVAQVLPEKFANVNIPVKNGVLSLRPKKLAKLQPDFIEAIDTETLQQIKTLHANLNLIVNMADKAAALK